ncbi:unnamed protein product [Closterium sp. NIES-53]
MGGDADEGPAIGKFVVGAGAVISASTDVASASADVASASADVASAAADVAATAVVCCITTNALVHSASGMVCEYRNLRD